MGSKLREARKKKKMSQSELAIASGVSRATICALESNVERSTSTKTLKKLADALGTTVESIFFASSEQYTKRAK